MKPETALSQRVKEAFALAEVPLSSNEAVTIARQLLATVTDTHE